MDGSCLIHQKPHDSVESGRCRVHIFFLDKLLDLIQTEVDHLNHFPFFLHTASFANLHGIRDFGIEERRPLASDPYGRITSLNFLNIKV